MTPRFREFDVATENGWGGWQINGKQAGPRVTDYLHDLCSFEYWGSLLCRFCQVELRYERFEDISDLDDDKWHLNRVYSVGICPRCAYWEFQGSESGNRCMDSPAVALAAAVAAKYQIETPPECATEFAQFVRRHPQGWHSVSPKGLEQLVAEIFRANHREAEVIWVGKPGDRGTDVIFVDDNSRRWLIQVKRRSKPGKKEGFSTLQAVLGTLALEGERHGMVVTTADAFSAAARAEAQRARRRGFVVELIDKGALDRMLGPLLPTDHWLAALELDVFDSVDADVRAYLLERLRTEQADLFDAQ
jgi:hypothetical protein